MRTIFTTPRVAFWCLGVLAVAPYAPAYAQSADTTTLSRISLFTRDDAYLGAFFALGTLALRPLDKRIAGELQEPSPQTNRVLKNLATDVRLIADPGSLIIGTSMYAVGRIAHKPELADLGLHGEEAIGLATVVTTAIKWTAGRARPYVVRDTNPSDFGLMRGFSRGSDYSSFPSGHTMSAFAAAAVVANEASRWWPGSQWYVGTVMYAGAVAVALSRMYDNKHWATDVIMGAGIGTFAGNKVVRFNHRTNPRNRLDRWLLSASVTPTGHGGLAVAWSLWPR
ncbi:MAG TPA: phosphatase PAP2 family protein [Gemmatimonadaceae bacterium]|jgi:membrane-associated phospholipid phosphatase|nr:phosphatase PAP2 family protein [Gemmatimonadaceae bacterium]